MKKLVKLKNLVILQDPNYLPVIQRDIGSDSITPGVTHWMGIVPVASLVEGISNTPNLRDFKFSSVAREVYSSLCLNDGNFHLKNKGITLLATKV